MNLCIIRHNSEFELITKHDHFKKLGVTEIYLYQEDLKDFDYVKEQLSINNPNLTSFEELFEKLGCDDYLVPIAQEIRDYGYWVAENDGYDSVYYDCLKIIKHDKYIGCSEKQNEEYSSFVDVEFARYLINNRIDSITSIFNDSTWY